MKNWSGNVSFSPSVVAYPTSEAEISRLVVRALEKKQKIRIIGSGHSFTPLIATQHILVSLDKYQGIISVDKEKQQVTVKAGTKLHRLTRLLDKEGLALQNMGDIDVQSIAGALTTGTHGTGTDFGVLSTQITELRFVNGLGEAITCSERENPEIFKAAQVSLGTLGIITSITLQCVPSYNLHLTIRKQDVKEVLANYEMNNANNRHYEFYWFPHTKHAMVKELQMTTQAEEKGSFKEYVQGMILENFAFKCVCELAHQVPSLAPRISDITGKTISKYTKVKKSFKVFSTIRMVRFNEMEYNVPIEAYREVKQEIMNWVNRHYPDVMFPIENRFVKGDDIYISPAYQRDSAYIAIHTYHKQAFQKYFKDLEDIFRAYDGRPHWGKLHTQGAADLAEIYPMFTTFLAIRKRQDPKGIFLSPYMETLLTKF